MPTLWPTTPCQPCLWQPPLPQGQHHKTRRWLHHQLAKQLPGPHVLITCTRPEAVRPFLRSHQRIASQAWFKAAATAINRLANDPRFIGTNLPGFPGVLHTWGRQLQSHPPMHSIVPGGGLSKARSQWLTSTDNFFVPVKALSPIDRAVCKERSTCHGALDHIEPQVWQTNWTVQSQASPDGHAAFTYLAPSVCKGAISTRRIVSLKGRTVTVT